MNELETRLQEDLVAAADAADLVAPALAEVMRSARRSEHRRRLRYAVAVAAVALPLAAIAVSLLVGRDDEPTRPAATTTTTPTVTTTTTPESSTTSTTTVVLDDAELVGLSNCAPTCGVTGDVAMDHPTWGPVHVVTLGPVRQADGTVCGGADILVIDSTGQVRWQRSVDPSGCYAKLQPAGGDEDPSSYPPVPTPVDDAGRLFITYNPGRYDGIIVLSMTEDGVDDHRSMVTTEDFAVRWYYASAVDVDDDGVYEIEQFYNDCYPTCAGGTTTSFIWEWQGDDFEPVLPTSPVACGARQIGGSEADAALDLEAVGITCPDAHEAAGRIGEARPPGSGPGTFSVESWRCTVTVAVPQTDEVYDCIGPSPARITFRRPPFPGD